MWIIRSLMCELYNKMPTNYQKIYSSFQNRIVSIPDYFFYLHAGVSVCTDKHSLANTGRSDSQLQSDYQTMKQIIHLFLLSPLWMIFLPKRVLHFD